MGHAESPSTSRNEKNPRKGKETDEEEEEKKCVLDVVARKERGEKESF